MSKKWDRDELARLMYERGVRVGPTWDQLGNVTRSVWYDKADRFLDGDPWWFLIGEPDLAKAEQHARRALARPSGGPPRRRLLHD